MSMVIRINRILPPKTYLNEGHDPSKLARKAFKTLYKKPQLSLDDVT